MTTKHFTPVLMLLVLFLSAVHVNADDKNGGAKKTASLSVRPDPKKPNRPTRNYSMAELTSNIEYDFAKISVRTQYYDKLDQLAKYVVDNNAAIALRGYADSIGTYKGNWVLSDKRAGAVKSYLVKKGVADNKIVTTPFGSTLPIASNKTKAGRQRNRRVEIKINETKN